MVKATRHGKERIKQRCGLSKKAADKIVDEAFKSGITHAQTAGSLNRYLTSLFFYNKTANNIRVYNDKVFIFSGSTLITVLNLPVKYKKTICKIQKHRQRLLAQ